MPDFLVSASHPVRPGFRKIMTAKPDAGPAGGFYVSDSLLGCGKTYDTAESAIRNILADHAYSVTMLRPVEVVDMPAPEDCASVKWRMVESGHWRAMANGREVWAFRSQPGSWQYGTAEGREDVASTGGAGSVTDAKRYAVALANALPADAKPLPVLHLGDRGTMWQEDSSLPDRAWVVRFYRSGIRPAPVPPVPPAPAPEVTSKPEAEAATVAAINDSDTSATLAADILAKSPRTDAAILAQYKPRNVPGLYSWSHFEHADGSAYQIRHGSEWRGVILAGSGSRREFESAADMLAALRQFREAADYLARDLPAGWTRMVRHDAEPSAKHRLRVYVMGGDMRVHLGETLESGSVHMLALIARDCGAVQHGRASLGRDVVRLEYIAPELESPDADTFRGVDMRDIAADSGLEAGAEALQWPGGDEQAEAEAELAAWFAKVDSALAILGEPATTGGEREAYPEAGLTDATADDFALYLAAEYRPRRAAESVSAPWLASLRTEDGTLYVAAEGYASPRREDARRYVTEAEAMAAAVATVESFRRNDAPAGSARAIRHVIGEG